MTLIEETIAIDTETLLVDNIRIPIYKGLLTNNTYIPKENGLLVIPEDKSYKRFINYSWYEDTKVFTL